MKLEIIVYKKVSLAWYTLGMYEQVNGYSITWLEKFGFVNLSYFEIYIYSLYWSVTTMTTVGYGDISASNYAEALFITIAMILFSCVFAYSVNNIGFILQEIEKASKQLNDDIATMQRYLNRKNVNVSLQSRVRHYLSFLSEEQKDRDQCAENEILGNLTKKLRDEIAIEINTRILKKYSVFSANFSSQTLRQLVFIMKEVLIAPNEIIFEEDDHQDQSLYMIENGIIEIYKIAPINSQGQQEQRKIHLLQQLNKNQLFGDISFFSGLARSACARSINLSTLYKINRNDFIELIQQNPEDFERFKMMEEQIKFQKDLTTIFVDCYMCNTTGHLASNCPRIHQLFDTQFKILKANFSLFQERSPFDRRLKKKYQNTLQFLQGNNQISHLLKENIRNHNTYTEIMFRTENEIVSDYSIDNINKDGSFTTTSQSSSSDESASQNSLTSSDSQQISRIASIQKFCASQTGALDQESINTLKESVMNKSTSSKNNRKKKKIQKGNKSKTVSSSALKSTTKEKEESMRTDNSFKEIEAVDNTNSMLCSDNRNNIHTQNIHTPNSNNYFEQDISQILDKEIRNIKSVSIDFHNTGGEKKILDEENVFEFVDTSKNVKQSNLRPHSLANKLPKQVSFLGIPENSSNNIPYKEEDNKTNEGHKDKNYNLQVNHVSWVDEMVEDNNQVDQRRKSKQNNAHQVHNRNQVFNPSNNNANASSSTANPKPHKSDKGRVSVEHFIQTALQSQQIAQNVATLMSLQNDNHRVEKSLNMLEDKIESLCQSLNAGETNQNRNFKNTKTLSRSSSMYRKPANFTSDLVNELEKTNMIHQNSRMSKDYLNIILSAAAAQGPFKSNLNPLSNPTHQQQENFSPAATRNSKYFGMQENLINLIKQKLVGGHMNQVAQYSNINNTLISLDRFDVMRNYKKFFPYNNFNQILHQMKCKKLYTNKKNRQKVAQPQIARTNRRQNILMHSNSITKSQFCTVLKQAIVFPETVNPEYYKPSFLSYGVSQKSDSIYPKYFLKDNIQNQPEII